MVTEHQSRAAGLLAGRQGRIINSQAKWDQENNHVNKSNESANKPPLYPDLIKPFPQTTSNR